MTEAELQEQVRHMCAQLGLYHYHPHDSRRSEAGWLDSTVMHKRTGAIMFAELKTASGGLTSAQTAVRYMHLAAGRPVYIWRPEHLLSGEIGRTLAAFAAADYRNGPVHRESAGPCLGESCGHVSHRHPIA